MEWYQFFFVFFNMVDNLNDIGCDKVVFKGLVKRKYLFVDNDFEGLEFILKDNFVNKSYGQYGFIFYLSGFNCVGKSVYILYFMFLIFFFSFYENI